MAAQLDLLALLMSEPIQAPPVVVVPTPKAPRRQYYRCIDCLSVLVTEQKLPEERAQDGWTLRPVAVCDACGGRLEHMGEVARAVLSKLNGYVPICDGRCTGAHGPSCDCKCGGEHHGSGMVVPVYHYGPIPRIGNKHPEQAKAKAEEYRALVKRFQDAWNDRYSRVFSLKRSGCYLDGGDYRHYMSGVYAQQALTAARQLRTHAGRNKRLAQVYAEYFGRKY